MAKINTKPLTERQADVLRYLQAHIRREGLPPTAQEIADHFGVVRNTITGHLVVLEKKGRIDLVPGRARGIKVLKGVAG